MYPRTRAPSQPGPVRAPAPPPAPPPPPAGPARGGAAAGRAAAALRPALPLRQGLRVRGLGVWAGARGTSTAAVGRGCGSGARGTGSRVWGLKGCSRICPRSLSQDSPSPGSGEGGRCWGLDCDVTWLSCPQVTVPGQLEVTLDTEGAAALRELLCSWLEHPEPRPGPGSLGEAGWGETPGLRENRAQAPKRSSLPTRSQVMC